MMTSDPVRADAPCLPRAAPNGYVPAILAIVALKLILLLLDPNPRFFLWDSVTYLQGALDGPLPRDRSFLYSLLIRVFALPTHSLQALVIAQTIAGMATSVVVFVILRRQLLLTPRAALGAALLVAVLPSQLFYEHMVMAEAFGGLLWLGFIALVLQYLRDARWFWLIAVVGAGIVTIAFRLNGTAIIILTGLSLCWLRALWLPSTQPGRWRAVALHFAIALLATWALHSGYRHLVAHVANTPPGYIGTEGLFLLGYVAPAVQADDFHDTGCAADLLKDVHYDLADPHNRERQLWSDGGIWSVMQRECPRPEAAAGKVAHRAFERIAPYVLPMAFSTELQYFDATEAQWRMQSDLGRKGQLPLELIEPAQKYFFLDAGPIAFTDTLSSVWFEQSRWPLTACFFLSPLLALLLYAMQRKRGDVEAACARLLALLLLGMFVTQFLLSPVIAFRYLHPFPPLFTLCAFALWRSWPRHARS